jgi:esterase/lipase superfamily enzyme
MKSHRIFLVLACLVIFGFAGDLREANAQTQLTDVTGTVVDEAGAAVPQATVVLINRATNEERTTKTDSSGEFIFHLVPLGSYTLKAAAGRLAGVRANVELSAERANRINLTLQRVAEMESMPPPPPPAPDHHVIPLPLPAARPPATIEMEVAPNYYTMKVFYATDRSATGQTDPTNFYGSDRDPNETLSLGTCEVSIPRDHRPGELEAPSIWKLEFHEDPEKHVVLLGVHPEAQNQFYSDLASTVTASENKEAFVFIHGYKTTFKDAARRTGQLAYDLNFHGAAIFYSWPSKGDLDGYPADEGTIIWTTRHLTAFLQQVALQSKAKTVHLIAHSMGNRALTQALADLAMPLGGTAQPHFREVILAAPDVDRDIFKQLAGAIGKSADRVTLYASSNDEALAASKRLHDFPRAGEAGQNLLVVRGIDTIDVSTVDTSLLGHSYFGDNTSVISDIHRLLTEGSPPSKRSCLSEAFWSNLAYWVFVRTSCPAH